MQKYYLILGACIALQLLPASGKAQVYGDSSFYQLTIEDLTSITVASNVITEREKQPVSVTTITREQLQLSGARLLSEAIMMYVPGFFLVEDQDDQIAGFRGMAADNNSKVMLLVNGQQVNTEFFWGPADALLNSTNYAYIERVEVIRGPGSVTLGQGALLGVINIVTRDPGQLKGTQEAHSTIQFTAGPNNQLHGSADVLLRQRQLSSYFYISTNRYNGQRMRNEGWAAQQGNQGFAGGTVADMGHRLHRTDNVTMVGTTQYKGFQLSAVYADQVKDLYNFYRDREVFQQSVTALSASYEHAFSPQVRLTNRVGYAQDHFALWSKTGASMGGTREDRYHFQSLLRLDNISRNRMAFGLELRHFKMGKANQFGNNFIANVVGQFDPITANEELTMGYRQDINVVSFFFEDFFDVNDQLDLFFAVRNDNHPFWGNSLTPRLGLLLALTRQLRLRASYQSGFRGAVGLHYTGGYRRDGFLRASNYGAVSEASIPADAGPEANIPETLPERMSSFEFALGYRPNKTFELETVLFYNNIRNVLDVGVIWRDPASFPMVGIGSDIPGDWNGYWFFKNTPGSFQQVGLETSLWYRGLKWEVTGSHALVRVAKATDEQRALAQAANSMYLSADGNDLNFKAYPQSVLRLHVMAKPNKSLRFSGTMMAYGQWYSPIGTKAQGGFVLNMGASYTISQRIGVSLVGKNLLGEDALYPMNSNAGGPDISPGTPGWERPSVWGTITLSF